MKHSLLFASVVSLLSAHLATGQLPNCLSMATDPQTGTEYCVSADGEKSEKNKTVELSTTTKTEDKKAVTKNVIKTTLRTGNSKSVAQTTGALAEVFQKFLSNPAKGTVLGKWGALDKGGEVEFVAASPEELRFDFKTSSGVTSTSFSKVDAKNYLSLLAK